MERKPLLVSTKELREHTEPIEISEGPDVWEQMEDGEDEEPDVILVRKHKCLNFFDDLIYLINAYR